MHFNNLLTLSNIFHMNVQNIAFNFHKILNKITHFKVVVFYTKLPRKGTVGGKIRLMRKRREEMYKEVKVSVSS